MNSPIGDLIFNLIDYMLQSYHIYEDFHHQNVLLDIYFYNVIKQSYLGPTVFRGPRNFAEFWFYRGI